MRLDLLIDLFDAARFGPDARAAESLFSALALEGVPHGESATRVALTALLDLSLDIEARAEGRLDDDARAFLNSAIALLNIDVNQPIDAEQLELQTLGYRALVAEGHPRIQDNARWRLYDHVRDALGAATRAQGDRQREVGLHALLVRAESLAPWLGDGGPHDHAAAPDAATLLALVDHAVGPLREQARWSELVERRLSGDASIYRDFEQVWPTLPVAALPEFDAGTGRAEHGLPRLSLVSEGMRWGHASQLHSFGFDAKQAVEQLAIFAERDGRLGVFIDADAELPAPDLAAGLRLAARSGVQQLELGLRERPLGDTPERQAVVTQLPLRVVMAQDHGPESLAFRESRLAIEISGRGTWIWADDQLVTAEPLDGAALNQAMRELKMAYPAVNGLRAHLHSDVRYPQLLAALGAALGHADAAPGKHFAAVGWLADAPRPDHAGADAPLGRAAVESRLALGQLQYSMEVIQPFPMREEDQGRADAMANRARACWVELGLSPKEQERLGAVEFTVSLHEGGVVEHDFAFRFTGRGKAPRTRGEAEARTHACLKDHAQRLRLPSHRDAFEMTFRYRVTKKAPGDPAPR